MNAIKRWVLTRLRIVCPVCAGELLFWQGCSHSPAKTYCPNCGYEIIHNGESASALAIPIKEKCPKCSGYLYKYMRAGEESKYCPNCAKAGLE